MINTMSRHRRKMAEGGTTDVGEPEDLGVTYQTEVEPNSKAENLVGELEDRLAGTKPEGTEIVPTKIKTAADADEGTKVTYTELEDPTKVTETKAVAPPDIVAPTTPEDGTYDYTATTTKDEIPEATAAQLTKDEISSEVKIGDIQGELSDEAMAEAAQTTVEKEQLVSYQLGELMESIEEGKPLPGWAAGANRAVTAIMQQRGLGGSSMAAAAQIQALVEAGTPIAAADAAEYSKINLANLNNRQQAALQNAAAVAQMDMANLDARMKAAVQNAQSFLSIDLANLTNEQATEVLNYQGELQALFTDAAADNAAKQFNAKTQQQVDEFFAELGVQVDNANANRTAAMEQFNADQVNSIAQFNASLEDARDRFNTQMQTQIDQSNAAWRREIATQDTMIDNEAQRQNALNTLELSQSALSALWQRYRDESAWLMQSIESEVTRAHQLAMLEFEKTANVEMFGLESEYETAASVGNAGLALTLGLISSGSE